MILDSGASQSTVFVAQLIQPPVYRIPFSSLSVSVSICIPIHSLSLELDPLKHSGNYIYHL